MRALATPAEVRTERSRRSLLAFVTDAWPLLEPAGPFSPGYHVEAICAALERVIAGDLRRLLINVPPRHGKSLLASVFMPAWAWASDPGRRFLYASYAQTLATRDSVRCRWLIESEWYQTRFGARFQLASDQNLKARFENDRGGARIATGVGGSATGEGGDVVVIDDPLKIEEWSSAAARQVLLDWYSQAISTRLNDPRAGATVVIGQRLHEDDLFGHLLRQGGWEHLCLPAEYEPAHPFLWSGDRRSTAGELLWPERFGPKQIAELKAELGSYGIAGQLQQRPAPAGGGIFRRHWWRWYDPERPPQNLESFVLSWDLSYGAGPQSDFVVGQVWAKQDSRRYLLRQIRARLGFTETIAAIKELVRWQQQAFPGHRKPTILVEQAANGAAAIDTLKRRLSSVIAVRPQGDKVARAYAVSPQIEAGDIWLPGAASADGRELDRSRTPRWVQDFVHEAEAFPNGAHDDQVDAMTQALPRLDRSGPRIRRLR